MNKIRDIYIKASTGWWVIDDQTEAKIEEGSYRNLKHSIIAHRKANDRPWNNAEIEDMIHRQVCEREPGDYCVEPGNKRASRTRPQPGVVPLHQMIANVTVETARWAAAGFPVTPEDLLRRRLETCVKCRFWDAGARGGLGKCNGGCGCTSIKHAMATAKCPQNLWPTR